MRPRGIRLGNGKGNIISKSIVSCNIIKAIKYRRLIWAAHVAGIEEDRTAFKFLRGEPTGNRSSGRSRRI